MMMMDYENYWVYSDDSKLEQGMCSLASITVTLFLNDDYNKYYY